MDEGNGYSPLVNSQMQRKTSLPSESSFSQKNPPGLDDAPTLRFILAFPGTSGKINLADRIGSNYRQLGILLLHNDVNGSLIKAIAAKHNNDHREIILDIMQNWLEGSGEKPTWRTLLEVLKDIGQQALANEIEKALDCSTNQENPEGTPYSQEDIDGPARNAGSKKLSSEEAAGSSMEKKLKLDETQQDEENKQKLAEEACKLKYELNELEKRFGKKSKKKPPKVSTSNDEEKAKNSLNPSPEAGNEATLPVMSPIPDDDVLLPSSEAGEENKDKKREASSNPENVSEEMGVSCGVDDKKEPPKPDVGKERAKPNVVDEEKVESPIPDLKAVSPKPEKKAESPKPEKTAESPKPEEKGKSHILNANEKKAGPPKPEFEDNGEEMEVLLRHRSSDEKKQSSENNVGNEKEIESLKPSVDEKKMETALKSQKTEESPKLDVSEKKVTSHNPESDSEEMEVSISDEKPKLDVDGGNEIESSKPNVYEVPKSQKTSDFGEKITLHIPESDAEEMEVLLNSEKLSGTCEKNVESPKRNVIESPKPEEMEILPSSVSSDEELPTFDVHAKTTVESPNPNVEKKLGSPVDKKNLESWTWTPKPIVEVETSKPLVEKVESEVSSSNLEVPPSIGLEVPSPSHKRSEKMEILANSDSSDTKAVPSDETEESLKNVQSPNPQSGIETTVASDKKKVALEHRLPAVDQKKFRSVYENKKKLKKLNELLEKYGVTLTDDGECDASLRPLLTVSNRKATVSIVPDEDKFRNFDLSITFCQKRKNAVKKEVEKCREEFRKLCPNGDKKLEIECKLGKVTVGEQLKNAKLNSEVWNFLNSEIDVQNRLRSEIMK